MSIEQEKHFEKLVPMKSALGWEYEGLKRERNARREQFEKAENKLEVDTTPYRYSEIALGRFLDDMLPLVIKTQEKLSEASVGLERAERKILNSKAHGIHIDRKSEKTIWQHFAIERYRLALPQGRKQFKAYQPNLYRDISEAWKKFRKEIAVWRQRHQPFDGSSACHAMILFFVKAHLLASVND